jgi:hypothetical protein
VVLIKINDIIKSVCYCNNSKIGLLSGKMGYALLQLYFGFCKQDNSYKECGIRNIENVFNVINANSLYSPSFVEGFAGIGWGIEHSISQQWLNIDSNMLLEDVDLLLAQFLNLEMQKGNHDFLYGASGIVLYFIARCKKNVALTHVLTKYITQISNTSEKHSKTCMKWKFAIDYQQQNKVYNISLSHGMSSIVVILSKLYKLKGMDQKTIKNLLQGCVNYILEQEIDKNKYGSFFPNFAIESMEHIYGSRLAWCYGDLGIAMALWQAGCALQNVT